MHFFLTLTTECNLRCRYCWGECVEDVGADFAFDVDNSLPTRPSYPIQALTRFLEKDPSPTLIFYGGEPLLEIEAMREVMDNIDATFMLQTNGLLLGQIPPSYLVKFKSIVVSIDGDEETTDHFRGEGTYRRVMESVRRLRENGYESEIVARMTVMEPTDIHTQMRHLLECGFDGVHWQLNALFWDDFSRRRFGEWAEESYNPGILKLVEFWGDEIKRGRVHRIYPFTAIMKDLLSGSSSSLRCGAGHSEYNIQTDGHITPCPVMQGMRDFYAGSIFDSHPLSLRRFSVGAPCPACHLFSVCGGRCLYANVTKRWGNEGFAEVCGTVATLVSALHAILPEMTTLIGQGAMRLSDFDYTPLNSCEIIP